MLTNNLSESLLGCSIVMQKHIDDLLPRDFSDSKLMAAMRYSALGEGKRIRPFLVMACAQIFGISILKTLNVAAALEFIHTYSLIHDDLPAMDDDDFRRGRPTCHKQFDEATAILAGDALLTYAFEILARDDTHGDANVRLELIKLVAKSSGFHGMVGGQMIDLESAGMDISKEKLAKLHRLKTGELFVAAAESGAILGRASKEEISHLRLFARDLGLAFQIKDDLLDYVGVENIKVEIDEAHRKIEASIVEVVGLEAAQKQLILLQNQTKNHLEIFGAKAQLLRDLVDFLTERKK